MEGKMQSYNWAINKINKSRPFTYFMISFAIIFPILAYKSWNTSVNLCLAIDYTTCSIDELVLSLLVGGCIGFVLGMLVWWTFDFIEELKK